MYLFVFLFIKGIVNVQGEDQKKLDVLANDVFINAITFSRKVYVSWALRYVIYVVYMLVLSITIYLYLHKLTNLCII